MSEQERFRVFATSRISPAAENLLRARGYDLEVFQGPEAPPKKLIIEKVKNGIDGLIGNRSHFRDAGNDVGRHRRVYIQAQFLPAIPAEPRVQFFRIRRSAADVEHGRIRVISQVAVREQIKGRGARGYDGTTDILPYAPRTHSL